VQALASGVGFRNHPLEAELAGDTPALRTHQSDSDDGVSPRMEASSNSTV